MPLITGSMTCSELWHRFRNVWLQAVLISLVFNPVNLVHAKYPFPAFWMEYEVKFSELNQARLVKPEVVFLNLHRNSFQSKRRQVRMVDQNGSKFEHFQNLFKKAIYPDQSFFRWENEKNSVKETLSQWRVSWKMLQCLIQTCTFMYIDFTGKVHCIIVT